LVAKRHYIILIVVRVGSEREHVLTTAEGQAARTVKVVLDVMWAFEMGGHLECRLAE